MRRIQCLVAVLAAVLAICGCSAEPQQTAADTTTTAAETTTAISAPQTTEETTTEAALTGAEMPDRISAMFLVYPAFSIMTDWSSRGPETMTEPFNFSGVMLSRAFCLRLLCG